MPTNQLNHIQVLRAISVLFVFFYHLKNSIFQNGYLGVDIFFVISGLVISLKLHENYEKTNIINIKEFFIKRIKRIYPVLLFFLFTTFLIILIFSPLDTILSNFKHLTFALLGIANFSYLIAKKDYFDNVFEDPLHHTWSLGVEEQFYLIYPFFLAACFFIFKKKISKIILTLLCLIVIGAYTTHQYSEDRMLIFYLPFFRFWQFLFGALIFFLLIKYKKKNSLISLLSFFLVFFIIFSQNYFSEFYKIFFITCFSGIFLLFYNNKNFLSFLFNNKKFVFFGNISYSFYLWHLPIIYFYDLYYVNSLIRVPTIFILTFIISLLSYRHVEQKYRYYKFKKIFIKKYIPIFLSSILIFLFSIYVAFYKTNGDNSIKNLVAKFNYLEQKLGYSSRTTFYKHNIKGNEIYNFCLEDSKNYSLNFLNLKSECLKNDSTKKIFFLEGNSHTANFVTMFENSGFIENFYYSHTKNDRFDYLTVNKRINEISEEFDEFFFVTAVVSPSELIFLKKRLSSLNQKIKILIIGPIPTPTPTLGGEKVKALKCFIKQIDCFFDSTKDKKPSESTVKEIEKLAQSNKIFFYNPYKGICPKKKCYVYNKEEDLLTHRDDSHLTIEGSKLLVPHFYTYYKNYLN